MGLLSLLGKAAITVAKNIDKIDDVSDIANLIPDKVNQVKEMADNVNGLIRQHRRNKFNKLTDEINEMSRKVAEWNAKDEGREYEESVQILDDKKLPVTYSIPPQYNNMVHIGHNLFSANLNNKWGIININNQIIIPFEYDNIFARYYDGSDDFIFPVQKNNKWGYINLKNKILLDFVYVDAYDFQQGLAPVAISNEDDSDFFYGYIDKTAEFIIPISFDAAEPFNDQNCATIGMYNQNKCDILYGVINKTGGIVINCRYDSIHYEPEYIICAYDLYCSDFYDYNGIPITPTEEMKKRDEEIRDEKDMLTQSILYRQNKDKKNLILPYFNSKLMYGYFIQTDEGTFCKIEPIFEEAYNPNKFGYARVKYNGLYGVINLNE